MSRIFQLDFLFLNKKHKALISIGSDVREPYIHVQIIDSLFKLLFPTEHIRYRGIDGYKKLELYKDPFIKKLIDAIGGKQLLDFTYFGIPTINLGVDVIFKDRGNIADDRIG